MEKIKSCDYCGWSMRPKGENEWYCKTCDCTWIDESGEYMSAHEYCKRWQWIDGCEL